MPPIPRRPGRRHRGHGDRDEPNHEPRRPAASADQPALASTARPLVTRRAALGAVGLGAAGLAGGAGFYLAGARDDGDHTNPAPDAANPTARLSVAEWTKSRGETYLIAHRGSGAVYPEHSIPAYDAAVRWGAQALEVSVRMTADNVLICLHDDTFNRTTNITGSVKAQPSAVLGGAYVLAPWLGPAWLGPTLANLLYIPRLEDVLQRFGGRVILCLEAKDAAAYDPMMAMVARYGLTDSVIAKVHATSGKLDIAQQADLPIFAYFGVAVPNAQIDELAAKLRPGRDYLVITPRSSNADEVDIESVRHAADSGITTWVGPIYRRYEVARYFEAGARGAVCANYGYQSTATAAATEDSWGSRAIASGEMTKTPGGAGFSPTWTGDADLTLAQSGALHFITLGNLSPVAGDRYQVEFEARWDVLPADATSYFSLAFGHADDRYYEARLGTTDGFHALLRANGALEVFSHAAGVQNGARLAPALPTPALTAGTWVGLRLQVSPGTVTWSRTDGQPVSTSAAATVTGGYLHIGRANAERGSSLTLRNLRVS